MTIVRWICIVFMGGGGRLKQVCEGGVISFVDSSTLTGLNNNDWRLISTSLCNCKGCIHRFFFEWLFWGNKHAKIKFNVVGFYNSFGRVGRGCGFVGHV